MSIIGRELLLCLFGPGRRLAAIVDLWWTGSSGLGGQISFPREPRYSAVRSRELGEKEKETERDRERDRERECV